MLYPRGTSFERVLFLIEQICARRLPCACTLLLFPCPLPHPSLFGETCSLKNVPGAWNWSHVVSDGIKFTFIPRLFFFLFVFENKCSTGWLIRAGKWRCLAWQASCCILCAPNSNAVHCVLFAFFEVDIVWNACRFGLRGDKNKGCEMLPGGPIQFFVGGGEAKGTRCAPFHCYTLIMNYKTHFIRDN